LIYNNLLYLLIVILVLTTKDIPEIPQVTVSLALPFFLLKGLLYHGGALYAFKRKGISTAPQYFSMEQKFSILAVISIAIDVYLLDCSYYFSKIPFTENLPLLISIAGLCLFFMYLSMLWNAAHQSYVTIFGGARSKRTFIFSNLRNILAIILPWLLLSLLSDVLKLFNAPIIKEYLSSPWGELTVFILFFFVLLVIFPLLVTKLWGCTPLPAGPVRDNIEQFCRRQKLRYADIMLWPLFEGKMLTAGVMGFIKKFRYLLITPALLSTLTTNEIEAVMAHEIGHVKRFHIQLYLLLFLGFGLFAQISSSPVFYLLLNSDMFYKIAFWRENDPGAMLSYASTTMLLLLLILYFRYIFGFFMRNFERQADIYALETTGHSDAIVSVFEKIARLSGNIRDLPSWHHFSIAQRIYFLQRCETNPAYIARHHRKVYGALLLYIILITFAAFSLWKAPAHFDTTVSAQKFTVAIINQKIQKEPDNPIWYHYLGDLQQTRKLNAEAIDAYEKALDL
jgi:Zn-dependent protease with chaperone function